MKLVKPQMLGFVQQTLEVRGKFLCNFGVPLLFELNLQPKLLPEVELWRLLGAELPKGVPFDPGVAKSRSEYVLIGEAFAPEKKPASSCHVRVRLGTLEKLLFVSGDRRWVHGAPTNPVAFQSMPLIWERAYGGAGFAGNPVGKGHRPVAVGGQVVHELPNVEDPRRPMRTLGDQALPASFAPLDMLWSERAGKRGTYDRNWLETRFPGLPDDFDWSFFNVAPGDQHTPEPFAGDEPIRLENLHPALPVLSARLPGVRARGFIRRNRAEAELEEVGLRLDTVWMFPKLERAVAVFHGAFEVSEDDSRDVYETVLALEALGAPKSLDHYRASLARRADPEEGPAATLDDRDLMPEGFELPSIEPKENIGAARNERQAQASERRIREAREITASHGLDPDEHAPLLPPPAPPPVTLENLPARLKQAAEAEARTRAENQQKSQELLADTQRKVEESGLDWRVFEAEFSPDAPGGPPQLSAQAELDRLGKLAEECRAIGFDTQELDDYLADPKFCERYFAGERSAREAYLTAAHEQNPPAPRAADERARLRARVVDAHARGESMTGWDLTGADLSGLSLPGAKLAGAYLEAADLSDTDLSGSDLTEAVLARANLTRARLEGASVTRANFGKARLEAANFGPKTAGGPGVDARGAVFAKTDLRSANLSQAKLQGADFSESKLFGTNFAGAELPAATVMRADLSQACFARAKLQKATFVESKLEGCDFSEAELTLVSFVDCKGTGAIFRAAKLHKSSFVMDCELDQTDFREAELHGATLRQQNLCGANFTAAVAPAADFSEARLEDAIFHRADAVDARFRRARVDRTNFTSANLMGADFQKAQAHGAVFSRSCLFRADFGRASFDRGTNFEGALLNQIKLLPRAANG